MLYEIRGTVTVNGADRELVRLHIGNSDTEAMQRFIESCTEYGDPAPTNVRVTARWSIQAR